MHNLGSHGGTRILETESRDRRYLGSPGDSYAQSSLRNITDPRHLHFTGVGTHVHRPGLGSPSGGWLSGTRKRIGPLGCEECSSTRLGKKNLSGGPNL